MAFWGTASGRPKPSASPLTKWDDTFAGLPVHTVPQLLG